MRRFVLLTLVGAYMDRKVSIVLTVFNMESCLKQAIDSVLQQTFSNYELICIDDGSRDGSSEILDSYAKKDSRVRVVHKDNSGPANARNVGLDLASGEYVILLDSDDVFEPNMLEKLFKSLERTGADISVCRSDMFDHGTGLHKAAPWTAKVDQLPIDKEVFTANDMPDTVLSAFVGWPWDKLYRRSFLEKHQLRFPDLKNSEDLLFVFMSLVLANGIVLIDDELIHHRMNRTGSVSNSRLGDPFGFYKATCMLQQRLDELPDSEKLRWGFDNWALDYALWNIETLPEGKERSSVLDELLSGKLAALNLSAHGTSYYSLVPDLDYRIKRLMGLAEPWKGDSHPHLSYVVKFLQDAQSYGWGNAIKSLFSWFSRKLGRTPSDIVEKRDPFQSGLPLTGIFHLLEVEKESLHGEE